MNMRMGINFSSSFHVNNHKDPDHTLTNYNNCLQEPTMSKHTNVIALIPKCMEILIIHEILIKNLLMHTQTLNRFNSHINV